MTEEKSSIYSYEIEDGEFFVIEVYNSTDKVIHRFIIKREVAIELAERILQTLGKY